MNEYDSAAVANLLESLGWQASPVEEAELVIVNTCAVRQNAEDRAIGRLLTIAGTYPEKTVGIMGCVAREKGEELLGRHKCIAFAIGPGEIDRIPEVANEISIKRVPLTEDRIDGCGLRAKIEEDSVKAYVAISRGCENYCSYCIVPFVRGRFRSRPVEDLLDEIERDISLGIKEITLLGQNVNCYFDTNSMTDFADLLYKIHAIDGLERIRFVTNHPKDMSDKIIEVIAALPKVCNSIHLPVQSGSTKILQAMNRGYSREQYLELVGRIKDSIPDIALTTDIITGFPGETDEDFEDTVSLYKTVNYAASFAFRYSVRPLTKASEMKDDVPEEIKIERLKRIIDIGQNLAGKYSINSIGKVLDVLVEGRHRSIKERYFGFAPSGRRVEFTSDTCSIGKIVRVEICEAERWLLVGNEVR